MARRFFDTNVFLRYVLRDHPIQSPASRALFRALELGQVSGWTTDLVISEIVFVLSNKHTYSFSRLVLRDALLPLIEYPALVLPSKHLYPRIFELYTSGSIDFVDAYHVALMESSGALEVYSYDHHFDKIDGVVRLEP